MQAKSTVEAVQPAIERLAAKLGVAADHIWAVLTRQAYVEAVESILFALLVAGVWVLAIKLHHWLGAKPERERDEWVDNWIFVAIVGVVALTVLTIIAILNLFISVGYLFNPEYFAVKEVFKALKQ